MIIATGNNFGAGQIEFKEYLSDNMIILNGRFSFDYTKEEYLNTDVLEIYVPELPMKRSLETAVFLTYENTYGRMGTIVKSWIKNKTTICLENLEINSKYGSREFWFMCAYLPMGQRNTFELEGEPADAANLKLVIQASAPQSNGVTRAYSKAVQIGGVLEAACEEYDIKKDYDEKHGTPNASSPKVFIKYFFVNTVTGEKSGEMMTMAVLQEDPAAGE